MPIGEKPTEADRRAVSAQLGRPARADYLISARGACGAPAVIRTPPRLPDGTPFPTHWYLTCRTLTAAVSTLEADGTMVRFGERLAEDVDFADAYRTAHEQYLRARESDGAVRELDGISAGGMPRRVKCLHALVAQSLAVGPGVNPVGDAVLERMRDSGIWPCVRSCARTEPEEP